MVGVSGGCFRLSDGNGIDAYLCRHTSQPLRVCCFFSSSLSKDHDLGENVPRNISFAPAGLQLLLETILVTGKNFFAATL